MSVLSSEILILTETIQSSYVGVPVLVPLTAVLLLLSRARVPAPPAASQPPSPPLLRSAMTYE